MYKLNVFGGSDENDEPQTIEGKLFCDLLEVSFNGAKYFSFNQSVWASDSKNELQTKLVPFLYKKIETPVWFGYDYTLAPAENYREVRVNIYRTDLAAKAILLEFFSDIFLRKLENEKLCGTGQNLEDLCFFTDNQVLLWTVSHEFILAIDPISKELKQFVDNHGKWKSVSGDVVDLSQYVGK